MNYISSPLTFRRNDKGVTIERPIEKQITIVDNLVELIAFTARGSFNGDPDFGLEYWNHEYANVSDTQFNSNNTEDEKNQQQSLKQRCEESMVRSIVAYAPSNPQLKKIKVVMNLRDEDTRQSSHRRVYSHHEVVIVVTAQISDGMGTTCNYHREVSFMVEPMARHK